jgi:hypothetical protein
VQYNLDQRLQERLELDELGLLAGLSPQRLEYGGLSERVSKEHAQVVDHVERSPDLNRRVLEQADGLGQAAI